MALLLFSPHSPPALLCHVLVLGQTPSVRFWFGLDDISLLTVAQYFEAVILQAFDQLGVHRSQV